MTKTSPSHCHVERLGAAYQAVTLTGTQGESIVDMNGIILRSAMLLIFVLAIPTEGTAAAHPGAGESKSMSTKGGRLDSFPLLVLWAWEKPERLGFIDVERVGVAFLSKSCLIEGDRIVVRPRMQALRTPPGTALIAVVRIESGRRSPPSLSDNQMNELLQVILDASRVEGLRGIQIDFDAKASQRRFYRELLVKLRGALPHHMALSITALSSWCIFDNWMADLPVDEIVPMVFRMGRDAERVRLHLASGAGFTVRSCRGSVGVCTDEPWPAFPALVRFYVFHPGPWSRDVYEKVDSEMRRGRK